MRLVGLEEGPRLVRRAIATPDQGNRDRIAQPQLRGKLPRLVVGVGLGLVGVQGLGHVSRLGIAAAAIPPPIFANCGYSAACS